MIAAVATEDWSQVVGACEVDSWKEALAAVLTYTKNDEFPALCGKKNVQSRSWRFVDTSIYIDLGLVHPVAHVV
jgi:protein transport protein SEC31